MGPNKGVRQAALSHLTCNQVRILIMVGNHPVIGKWNQIYRRDHQREKQYIYVKMVRFDTPIEN